MEVNKSNRVINDYESNSSPISNISSSERNMAKATQQLHDISYHLPNKVRSIGNTISEQQQQIQKKSNSLSERVDGFEEYLVEWGKEMKRLELESSLIAGLEDWINITVSEVSQLKSQVLFINRCMDS